MRTARQVRRSSKGVALIEFALCVTVIMVLLFLVVQFTLTMYAYNIMADAAKEGLRYAIVHGANNTSPTGPATALGNASSCSNNTGPVYTRVQQFAGMSLSDITGMTVRVCYLDGSNQPSARVSVNVTYPIVPYISLPWPAPTVHATAQGNIVN